MSWSPRPLAVEVRRRPGAARSGRAGVRPWVSASSSPRDADQVALLLELALDLPQGAHVVDRRPRRAPAAPPPRRCRPGWRPGSPAPSASDSSSRSASSASALGRVAEAERLARRASARRACPGRGRGAGRAGCRRAGHLGGQVEVAQRLGHQLGQLLALLGATASRIIRSAAAARRASASTSSSRFCGLSGKKSPCCVHELVEVLGGVLAAGVGARAAALRSASMSLSAWHGPRGSAGLCSASFIPRNCWSSTSRRSRSRDLLVRLACLRRAPVVVGQLADRPRRCRAAACPARPRATGRRRTGRGRARRAPRRPPGRAAARACSSVPSSRPRRAARGAARCARRSRSSRPRSPSGAAPQQVAQRVAQAAWPGQHVARRARRRRARTSYGGASGSGPSSQAPYR